MVNPLPHDISEREVALRSEAFEHKKQRRFSEAEKKYLEAWNVLPNPKHEWDTSQSVLRSIRRFYMEQLDYKNAEHWTLELFKCVILPADPTPFIELGIVYFESGEVDLASKNLTKAFELGGRRGFVGEDPKYLKFAQEQMKKK